ncbi:pimeloyl-ACP methyl ester carboxylesterase [Tamaricihabitans halophyticus]|uniref:Pimeloyl-ACP methyl ester carboxylesterase n=1 Tax=Tamaricihabitans halophyticus TaxID=1262583 RepID=A0A4V2SV83_9PSEU|nr:alpha/beta hydrolase [Tamaricihabitans halophyticus]TCP57496.1 pimeloyl-ACP methyl ester carboxylesterase [Tamaricihabitans halophyticus]
MRNVEHTWVALGERRLCTKITGSGPSVVLDCGGTGEGIGGWGEHLEAGIGEFATAVAYDRAGIGRSDGPRARTVGEMAEDLHRMVRAAELELPAVFVGWSHGALVVQLYAARYPQDVAGLLFIDPTPAKPSPAPTAVVRALQQLSATPLHLLAAGAATGMFRSRLGRAIARRFAGAQATEEGLRQALEFVNSPAKIRQLAGTITRLDQQITEVHEAFADPEVRLPDVPTTVLTAGSRPARMPEKYRAHLDASHQWLADLSPQGRVVIAEQATHQLPLEHPKTVIAELRELLHRAA